MSMIPGFRLHRSLFSLATYPDWTLKQATMEAHITQNTLIWLVLSMVCNWKVQPPGGNGIHVQSDQWTNRQQMNLEASWQGDITQIATHRIAPQFSWLPMNIRNYPDDKAKNVPVLTNTHIIEGLSQTLKPQLTWQTSFPFMVFIVDTHTHRWSASLTGGSGPSMPPQWLLIDL